MLKSCDNRLINIYVSYIPTKEEEATPKARVPQAIGINVRKGSSQATTSQGASQADRLVSTCLRRDSD